MKEDIIDIEILDEGTIKSTTPKISAANHAGAHEFFRQIARLTGGEQSASKAKHNHTHVEVKETQKEGQ